MHANNEIGNILSVKQVKKICDKYGAIFHSDTVQTIGKYQMDIRSLGFDFAIASAHKFHGPKGVGFAFINSDRELKPLITGGMQERSLRAGTENVCSIAGMSLALELALKNIEKSQVHIQKLKYKLIERINNELPDIKFYGDPRREGLYTLVNLSLPPGEKSDMLAVKLDIEGIAVSGGSACSSGSNKPSHVISSLGIMPERPSLRISFSKLNTEDQVDKFVEILKEFY